MATNVKNDSAWADEGENLRYPAPLQGSDGNEEYIRKDDSQVPLQQKNKKPPAPQDNLDSCNMCMRYILIVSNCVFFLLGCTVIGLGIYVVVDKVNIVSALFGIPLVSSACYLIIAAGCIMFLISFVGCFGALVESKTVLIIYSTALGIVLLLSCLGFTLAIVFRSQVKDQIREYMKRTLTNEYGVNLDNEWNVMVTKSWDRAQWKWYCCAVDDQSWGTYKGSQWYIQQPSITETMKPLVPSSCCVRDQYNQLVNQQKCQEWPTGPPTIQSGDVNEAVYYRGCYAVGKAVMYQISGYVIGIGVALTVLVIAVLVMAVQLARHV